MPIWLQKIIPHHFISRIFGWMANCHWQWFKNAMIWVFIQIYKVDLAEALETDYKKYPTFNAFFTRQLRPDARPIATDSKMIVSPVDGKISELGVISEDKLIQAKGVQYSLVDLLAGKKEWADLFAKGVFFTAYLAPREYHRVHMPYGGQLMNMALVPGQLFSVNAYTVTHLPHLFTKNERVICLYETDIGHLAVILVGALNVGKIHTSWHGFVTPKQRDSIELWDYPDRHVNLAKGAELGFFQMGSTVILLFESSKIKWLDHLQAFSKIQMGGQIATLI